MHFNLSGADTLTYREMVSRVFITCGLNTRLVALPVFLFRFGVFRPEAQAPLSHWSLGMALRMNQDQTCDHSQAPSVLGFSPQGFTLEPNDLPAESIR